MVNQQRDNYKIKMEKLFRDGNLPVIMGQANIVDVKHDDWCGVFRAERCNCDPDIVVRKRDA